VKTNDLYKTSLDHLVDLKKKKKEKAQKTEILSEEDEQGLV